MHLRADDPHEDVGDDDRQADRHHGLTQILARHEAEDRYLHGQADQRRRGEPRGQRQQPGAGELRGEEAEVAAQQVQRAVREVDVAHEPEHEREAAGHDEVERGQREAVEQRDDEQARVVVERPPREGEDRHPDQQRPHHAPQPRHAMKRLRAERISGALANSPSFMMASSFDLSWRMEMLASGSPSTSKRSASQPSRISPRSLRIMIWPPQRVAEISASIGVMLRYFTKYSRSLAFSPCGAHAKP